MKSRKSILKSAMKHIGKKKINKKQTLDDSWHENAIRAWNKLKKTIGQNREEWIEACKSINHQYKEASLERVCEKHHSNQQESRKPWEEAISIAEAKNNKEAGEDDVRYEFIKHLGHNEEGCKVPGRVSMHPFIMFFFIILTVYIWWFGMFSRAKHWTVFQIGGISENPKFGENRKNDFLSMKR